MSDGLPKTIDLRALRRMPKFAFYFRYPLHQKDFHEIREGGRLRGYYAAKPLYGRLTAAGKVDRSVGFNGEIAAIFIPSPARSLRRAERLVTRMRREKVTLSNGKRNWPAIRQAAEEAILERLGRHQMPPGAHREIAKHEVRRESQEKGVRPIAGEIASDLAKSPWRAYAVSNCLCC